MQPDDPASELVARAQAGDQSAAEDLFRMLYPDLLQAARARLGPALRARLDSVDVAQSVWLAVHRDLARFERRGKGSFRRWLFAIVENEIRAQAAYHGAAKRDVRRDAAYETGMAPSPSPTPSRALMAEEAKEKLEQALDALPEDQREVIVQRHYLQMSWREVGEAMNRSEAAAKMLFQRAIQRLRELYRESSS